MRLIQSDRRSPQSATVAQVSFSDTGGFGAVGAAEYRGVPVFAPRGISYRPCEGDNLLILPVDGTDVCAGVLSFPEGLESGELRIAGAGGGSILMRKNGDVVINGLTITKAGAILPAGEGA